MWRFVGAIFVLWVSAVGASAQAQLSIAMDHLKVAELIDVMRIEGADYAETLNAEMLNGQGGPVWANQVTGIYNPQKMSEVVPSGLAKLSDDHLRDINQFYGSDLGTKVIKLEVAGRRAMMQDDLKNIAQDTYQIALAEDPKPLEPIHIINGVGDMVERNVTAALTANYHFYLGMGSRR